MKQEPATSASAGYVIPESLVSLAPADQHATLLFMNRAITFFRAEVTGSSPELRAADATRRIDEQMKNRITGPVDALDIHRAVLIRIAGKSMFALTEDDLDRIAGETLESRKAEAIDNLERAIAEAEELLLPQQLIRRVALALERPSSSGFCSGCSRSSG